MKVIKYLIWFILVSIVLVVGAAVYLINTVDPNDYKPKIAELVKKQTGRDINLDGELALTFFPWAGIETGQVSLSNAAGFGDAPMVSVENARAKVKLMPLLKKIVEVDTVVLEKPVIRLSAKEDGTTNWSDLLKESSSGQQQESSSGDATKGASAIAGLAVQGVSIVDGYVEWVDGRTDKDLTLKELNLSTGTLIPGEPLDIQLTFNADGNLIPEPSSIALDTTVTVNDKFTDATLDNTDFSIKMNSIAASLDAGKIAYGVESGIAAIAELSADVDYQGSQSSLKASKIDVDTQAETLSLPDLNITQGDTNLIAAVEGAGILSNPSASGKLELNSSDINALLANNGLTVPQLTQTIKNLVLKSDLVFKDNQVNLSGLAFAADVNTLPTSLQADALSVGIADASFKAKNLAAKQQDFTLRLDAIELAGGASGNDELGFPIPKMTGNLSATISNVAELISRNGIEVDLPEIPVTNLVLSAALDSSSEDRIQLSNADIKLDHQAQPTTISIPNLMFGPKDGTLELERIDINQGGVTLAANASGSNLMAGLAKMNLKGVFAAKVPSVGDLLQKNAIEVELPQGVVNAVDAKFGYALANNSLTVNQLDAKIDEMTIKGDVSLDNLDNPGYRFDLAINKLDVDALLASMEQGESAAGTESEQPSTAEQLLLPVAPLRGLNVDGKAQIGQFVTSGMTLDDVNIVVKSDKNVLRVVPITAKLFGGTMETQLTYDVSKDIPTVKTVNKVDSVDIGALLQALDVTDKISGTGNLSTNLAASGADVDKMISTIAGDIDFRMFDGAIKGYDLQGSLIELEKTVKSFQGKETTERATPAAETKFAEFSGSLKAKDGVFRNNDLSMKAPLFRLGGEGVINLPSNRLDYKLDVNVVETVEGQGGASLDDLEGQRIPFKIYGPLNEPSFTFDLASLAKERAKKEIKKEVKKKLLDKLSPDLAKELGLAADEPAASAPVTKQAAETAAEPSAQPEAESVPEDPKKALEDKLKKKLKDSLLKGLFN